MVKSEYNNAPNRNLSGGYTPRKQDSVMVGAPFPDPKTYIPDPKKHLYVSLAKSVVRIGGYALLLGIPSGWAVAASIVLIASELIGIVEELV